MAVGNLQWKKDQQRHEAEKQQIDSEFILGNDEIPDEGTKSESDA